MARWHEYGCLSPDVYIDNDNAPTCRACWRTCPPAYGLFPNSNSASSGIEIPPDEPHEQLNLRWPKDVRYANLSLNLDIDVQPQSSPPSLLNDGLSGLLIDSEEIDDSQIYTSLSSNEFRLAFLTVAPSAEYPMHLSLETYSYNDRPEYETVSYQWGGENGDSSPCRPIFIGPYWDVLWQSQNCWAMLRFARPRRGTRMIWVDALCT
jgi:hypothetical protein